MQRRLLLLALTLVALAAGSFLSSASATQPKCLIVNLGGIDGSWSTLQAAQDAASAGDTLKVKGTCYGLTTLSKDLTIVGQSNPGFGTATLDGAQAGSVVTIGPGVSAAISGLTITNGKSADFGGGIKNSSGGSVTLTDSIVTGNTAPGEPVAVPPVAGLGGGIYNGGVGSVVTLTDSTVSGNTAARGGGIFNELSGSVTLTGSTVSGNTIIFAGFVTPLGGGILNQTSGSVTLTDSIVSGNTAFATPTTSGGTGAAGGGGIGQGTSSGPVTLTNSSVTGNSAPINGGGIYLFAAGATPSGPVTLTNTSLSGNSAGQTGGGIRLTGGSVTMTNSTVSGNTAPTGGGINRMPAASVTLIDSTVSNNTATNTSAPTGGGIFSAATYTGPVSIPPMTLTNSTVTGNHPDDCVGLGC